MQELMAYVTNNSAMILTILLIALLVLVPVLIIVFIREHRLNVRMNMFMRGTDGVSLERSLRHVVEDNKRMMQEVKQNRETIERLQRNMLTSYRRIGIVKYNAFPGMAGKMSSSIALLNNEGNGIIINSMHGPDGCYTYVREIMNGKSFSPLTKEDEEALKKAEEIDMN